MSVAHRASLSGQGFGATEVARPVGQLAEPPETAAFRAGGTAWLAFTAVGSLARTAVGLVRLDGAGEVAPVVPGTGYGVLHVDAVSLGEGALLAADVPQAAPPESPRAIHVRALDADGQLGPPTTITGPGGHASRARVAVAGSAVGITFIDGDRTYVVVGRCAISP